MQDNLALAIKNLVLDNGINIPASTPKSNVQDLKKPDLFSLTKETELFQNEKGITTGSYQDFPHKSSFH